MKKIVHLFIAVYFLLKILTPTLQAQMPTFSKIYYQSQMQVYAMIKTYDNKYVVAGEESYDALIFKTDTIGNILWKKKIGGSNNDKFNCLIQSKDSCFILAGNTVNASTDIFCVKINSNGDTLWTKEIDMGGNDYVCSLQQTYDKGFVLAGYSVHASAPLSTIMVVKLDSAGNIKWGKSFSGGNVDNYAYSVKQLPDSGYVVIGFVDSLSINDPATFLMKLSGTGDVVWTKKQKISSSNYTYGNDVIVETNGLVCHLLTKETNAYSVIMKTDLSGNVLWCKKNNYTGYMGGNTELPLKLYKALSNKYIFIHSDGALIEIDTAGNSVWAKQWELQSLNDFFQNSNKGFLILGNPLLLTKSAGYISIIKTDSAGNNNYQSCLMSSTVPTNSTFPISMLPFSFTSSASALPVSFHPVVTNSLLALFGDACVVGNIEENKTDEDLIKIYPDPAINDLTIETLQKSTIEILNIEGQIIRSVSLSETSITIDISDLAGGLYLVKVKNENGVAVKKFIKE
jgi:hypothetical protein